MVFLQMADKIQRSLSLASHHYTIKENGDIWIVPADSPN